MPAFKCTQFRLRCVGLVTAEQMVVRAACLNGKEMAKMNEKYRKTTLVASILSAIVSATISAIERAITFALWGLFIGFLIGLIDRLASKLGLSSSLLGIGIVRIMVVTAFSFGMLGGWKGAMDSVKDFGALERAAALAAICSLLIVGFMMTVSWVVNEPVSAGELLFYAIYGTIAGVFLAVTPKVRIPAARVIFSSAGWAIMFGLLGWLSGDIPSMISTIVGALVGALLGALAGLLEEANKR